jgi:beta-galactosidase
VKKKDFNRGWLFGAVGKEPSMQPVTLPHDAMLYEKRSKDAATAGACGYFPGGTYVYVKRIFVPGGHSPPCWNLRQFIKTHRCS